MEVQENKILTKKNQSMEISEKHFGPVWFIPGENKGKYPYCHSLYIEDAGILIDPASNRERLVQLKEGPGIKEIWLSHWHEDHLMYLDLFEDIPICMMESDAAPLSDLETFMEAYGVDEEHKEHWRPFLLDTFNFKPRKPSRFFKDGEWIDLGSTRVKVIHAPGHTPGHTAFLFEEPELLFLGDYDLSWFGPWYGDVDSSIEQTIDSVNKLRKIPAKTWVTCHETGLFEKEPGELWDSYLKVIDTREKKLLDLLKTPRTLLEVVQACILYGKPREPKYFFEFGEKAHMTKHLERLMRKNKIALENEKYSIL